MLSLLNLEYNINQYEKHLGQIFFILLLKAFGYTHPYAVVIKPDEL